MYAIEQELTCIRKSHQYWCDGYDNKVVGPNPGELVIVIGYNKEGFLLLKGYEYSGGGYNPIAFVPALGTTTVEDYVEFEVIESITQR